MGPGTRRATLARLAIGRPWCSIGASCSPLLSEYVMLSLFRRKSALGLFVLLPACGLTAGFCSPRPIDEAAFAALYAEPLPPAEGPLQVYHLGHSLVGRDMPVMLAQLAGDGHVFHSQLGWGAFLRQHWEPDVPVNGFAKANFHPQHRDPREALATGEYDALVLTEAVEIRDSIRWFAPADYLHRFAELAWENNPDTRVYLYETWHRTDGEEDWFMRVDRDLGLYWEGEILRRAIAYDDARRPIYVIPGGQVMAAVAREAEARGGVGPLQDRDDLFSDNIHFSDYGAYLMALTHYAVLYRRSPVGLPHGGLTKLDGSPAADPGAQAARMMQEIVWRVVTSYAPTGVSAGAG